MPALSRLEAQEDSIPGPPVPSVSAIVGATELVRLRWVAVIGQLVTITVVRLGLACVRFFFRLLQQRYGLSQGRGTLLGEGLQKQFLLVEQGTVIRPAVFVEFRFLNPP